MLNARGNWSAVAARCMLFAWCLLVPTIAACTTAVPVSDRTLAAQPAAWVAVVPRAVRAAPEFTRLVDVRKKQYAVEVIEYNPAAGSPEERLALVQSTLERLGAGTDGVAGYVLLIGGPTTLPMGPWRFEGVGPAILTDFPLSAALDTTVQPLPAEAWQAALLRSPRWLVGRIPFDEESLAVRMLGSTAEQMRGSIQDHGDVLLGAGGTFSSWALASSRGELRKQGWHAELVGCGGSCDFPATCGILPEWEGRAPQLVVMATQSESTVCGGGLVNLLPGASARSPGPGTPPALMVAFASCFGTPENEVLRSLINDGWVAGGVAFTGSVDPAPLGAAWRQTVQLPANLASGAALGNSAEASRRRYWVDAGRDWGIIFPSTRRWQAQNALCMVVYGDPALRVAGSTDPQPVNSGLPLLVSTGTGSKATGALLTTDQAEASAPGTASAWIKWLGLGALLVLLLTVLYWMLVRRK